MFTEGLAIDHLAVFGQQDNDCGSGMGGDAGDGDGINFLQVVAVDAYGFGDGVAEAGFGGRVAGVFVVLGAKCFREAVLFFEGDAAEDRLGGYRGAGFIVVGVPEGGCSDMIQGCEVFSGAGQDDEEFCAGLEVPDEVGEAGFDGAGEFEEGEIVEFQLIVEGVEVSRAVAVDGTDFPIFIGDAVEDVAWWSKWKWTEAILSPGRSFRGIAPAPLLLSSTISRAAV